jgi:hypothetical protein
VIFTTAGRGTLIKPEFQPAPFPYLRRIMAPPR